LIGTVLDKYEVLQKVGEGGMATVYLGRHTTLGRDVAIKVLHPHLSSSIRNRKRFAREARAIEHLRHDNILEIFDYSGTDCSDCYIITEFVQGATLASLMNRVGRMPSEVVATIGLHLAEALGYAHAAGILHRDLKPDNVMIRADGVVKLMDFGIARFLDESQVTMTGALVGSPAFMSPEQAREGELDARSDLFSLGTLLFHLVTGHLPFAGTNPSLILKNIIEGNRPHVTELAPTMSASLADVIERCMQIDRDERYPAAEQVAEALQACLEEVGFDPKASGWGLADYVRDPGPYQERLEEHLGTVLLEQGKTYLAEGDPLAALRLFNRLLTLDEDNPEVLDLVQGLHDAESPRRRTPLAYLLLAAGLALVAALGMGWFLRAPKAGGTGPVVSVTAPAPPDPGAVASAEPAPSPKPMPSPKPAPSPSPTAGTASPRPVPAPAPAPRPETHSPRVTHPSALPRPVAERLTATGTADDPAEIQIRATQPYAAEIYENGKRVGSVREVGWIQVDPGEHLFVLQGPGIYDYALPVAVSPGEHRKVIVDDLQPKPVPVAIDPSFPDDCQVSVNDAPRGTLAEVDHTISLADPQTKNIVVLDCGKQGVFRRIYDGVDDTYLFTAKQGTP